MNVEYYVFDTEATAIAAEAWISAAGGLPRTGKNAKTGQENPTACKTVRWAIPKQRLDGKWIFERVPKSERDKFPPIKKNEFDSNFPHVIEIYNSNWFETPEEI